MARIIGYVNKKKYKTICSKCGAIVVFEEDELTRNGSDGNFYSIGRGRCPGCESEVVVDLLYDVYEESKEPFQEWPKISNCIGDCEHCSGRCLYRRNPFQESGNLDSFQWLNNYPRKYPGTYVPHKYPITYKYYLDIEE